MMWHNYLCRPTSLLFSRRMPVDPKQWMQLLDRLRLIRCPVEHTDHDEVREGQELSSPEDLLGAYFCPSSEVSWEVLQVAGLLIKSKKLDVKKALFSAKRYGGEIYFKWFLYHLGELSGDNPLPGVAFPLHPSRWQKKRAGENHDNSE